MSKISVAYSRLIEGTKIISDLTGVTSLLEWDQEVCMPPKGIDARSRQTALLTGLIHERATADERGELLEILESKEAKGELDADQQANILEIARSYKREKKLTRELVEETALVVSQAQAVWIAARKKSDFAAFEPKLKQLVGLKREAAKLIGYKESPYDALLDAFEPYMTAKELTVIFDELHKLLTPLVKGIAAAKKPRTDFLARSYPIDTQREFGSFLVKTMGFDFEAGRLDVSTHPFCTGMAGDVRLTTRYNEHAPTVAWYGLMHEAGHGIYEQGVDASHLGTPRGEAVSMAVHESQSRMWENMVGRGRPFSSFVFPELKRRFASELADVTADEYYAAINEVKPSFIRVEADEVTYNLHIILRFEIERDLIEGKIETGDLPALWNRRMTELMGITPANDAQGVLQDIHWSMGLFGYFPTYALGNIYAAQIYDAATTAISGLEDKLAKGETGELKAWLNSNIHVKGKLYSPAELVRRVTGSAPSARYLSDYLSRKYGSIYSIKF